MIDTPLAAFDKTLEVDLRGYFLMTQAAARLMAKNGGGSIINIGSNGGQIGYPNQSAYGASKGAVHQLTRSTAAEFVDQGIRVNTVAPGSVFTPMARAQRPTMTEEEARENMRASQLMGRVGTPQDIANAVLYLASDESRFMTGAELKLDGGISAM